MRGSIDCGLTVSVDYATQRPAWAVQSGRKPIKNRELGGSVDTCIGVTRQERTHLPPAAVPRKCMLSARDKKLKTKRPDGKPVGASLSADSALTRSERSHYELSGLKPDQRCAIGLASRCVSPMNS
jgi:hypothetical protein